MTSRSALWLFVVAAFVVVGCPKPDEPNGSGETGKQEQTPVTPTVDQKKQPKTADKPDPPVPTDTTRQTLAGRWAFLISLSTQPGRPRRDLPALLLDVAAVDGKTFRAKVLAGNVTPEEPSLTAANFTADTASFSSEISLGRVETTLSFQGSLKDGVVWGNVLIGDERCEPARLVPTNDSSFDSFAEMRDPPGYDEMQKLLLAEDNLLAEFQRFYEQHRESPLALDARQAILILMAQEKAEQAEIEKAADEFLRASERWGTRLPVWNRIVIARILADRRYFPALGVKYLDDAEARLTNDFPKTWKSRIPDWRSEVATAMAIWNLTRGTKEEQQQAFETLRGRAEEDAFNYRLLYVLADYAEQNKQIDEAMRRYGQLATIPQLSWSIYRSLLREGIDIPKPEETVAELWKEKHGNTDGLDEYLNRVYRESLFSFAGEKAQPRPADGGNRVVLCELFTGTRCPFCLAADVATGGLEAVFDKSDVIVLRYHVRIPAGDPMESEASWTRYPYYNPLGAPTTCVNGKPLQQIGGRELVYIAPSYQRLREAVDPILAEKTDVKIKLTADAKGGKLAVSANVTGLKELSDKLRLRLVLAEDEIAHPAANGIRLHEMVVRSMPGGVGGIAPKDGKLTYSETITLADFKRQIVEHLSAQEEAIAQLLPVKPLELQKMHLVGFVQDDSTREVLQAAAVPVTGKLEYPPEPKKAEPKPKPKTEPKGTGEKPKQKEKPKTPQPPQGPKITPPKTAPSPSGKTIEKKEVPAKPKPK